MRNRRRERGSEMTSSRLSAFEESASGENRLEPISLAVAKYDRTQGILDGSIKPRGIALKAVDLYVGDFCVEPIYEKYDAAEMSFSWYVMARSRGEPVVALPVFLLRMPVFAYVFVRSDSPDFLPKDLVGKRIGAPSYRFTVNLWLRGMFQEHYGLAPDQVDWVTCEKDEGAGYVLPPGIKLEVAEGRTAEQLLANREVDAILLPRMPSAFPHGAQGLRRLFKDAQAETHDYFRRTGVVPITHVLVLDERRVKEKPWLCESLYRAFVDAQDQCAAATAKYLSMSDAVFYLEQNRAAYGPNAWAHGFAKNRHVVDTFLRYAHEQNYTARRLSAEELFPPQALTF
jgi:4,5-dihydroxyphthalate decarboxylase